MAEPKKGEGSQVGNAAARYTVMSAVRQTVLERARKASALTIPGIIPLDGQNEHSTFEQPYQSLGARCVSHLSSALLLALFPPNLPFFRLNIDELTAKGLGDGLGETQGKLSVLARVVYSLMEGAQLRPTMVEVLRHLIVAGNALLFVPEKGTPRIFRLDQFVLRRDQEGRLIEAVAHEKVYPSSLDEGFRASAGLDVTSEEMVDLHTYIERVEDKVLWRQEVKGQLVPESEGTAPADASPWIALRWLSVPGSDYGRSHVTEYIGDFLSLEDLYKAMVQFAAEASRIIRMVDPNSGIDVEELAEAETGDFILGNADRVKTLQLDKSQDWAVMSNLAERLEQRLSAAFLLRTGVTRDAERVTAEEVRLVAQELENVLGGTYTVLSAELQLPLVRRFMWVGVRLNRVPELPSTITPAVVTGFDALGRAHGANRIRAWIADLQAAGFDVPGLLKGPEVARRLGDSHGVDGLDDLLKTEEDQAAEAEQAQSAAAMQSAVPHIAKAAGEAALTQPQEQA